MGRLSVKENKGIYQLKREALNLSRSAASESLCFVSPERIEKIENDKSNPNPEEVLAMSKSYKAPDLCNYYCTNECSIGKQYVPELKIKSLSQIVLEMLSALNDVNKEQEHLIEITASGSIKQSKIKDFVDIQNKLERISISVETLKLWVEQMLAYDVLDTETYYTYKNQSK